MRDRIGWSLLLLIGSWLVSLPANAAVGRTAGAFDVSATGAATYQIPIWVPPGPKGIQPNLGLTYNSQAGNGAMGPGWSLAGITAITRCNKTYAQDGTPAPVALVVTDGYCLNGSRLRLTGGTYGGAGSTYQTEVADFSQITANGATGNGPASFTVQGKDGLTYEYGTTADSAIKATPTTISQWLLNKVRDPSGNNYIVSYGTGQAGSTGIGVPMTISYTPSSTGASSYNYTVNFNYELFSVYGPGGAEVAYVGGTLVKNTNVLSNVTIKNSASTVLRKYAFTYQSAPTTARARLSQVKECADDAQTDCLSPTTVAYQDGQPGVAAPTAAANTGATSGQVNAVDVNGDGRSDLIYSNVSGNNYHWYVKFADSSGGFGSAVDTTLITTATDPVLFDDFLGEGQVSMLSLQSGVWYAVRWNGGAFTRTSTGLAVDPNRQANIANDFATADTDGDGLPDLSSVRADGTIYIRRNTSVGGVVSFATNANFAVSSFDSNHCNSGPFALTGNNPPSDQVNWSTSFVRQMDFNGDGRRDVILGCHWIDNGSAFSLDLKFQYVLLSQGATFSFSQDAFGIDGSLLPVNWNNDGCTDYLYPDRRVYLSGCNGTLPAYTPAINSGLTVAMDWDGDGRTDLLVASGGTFQLYRSTGDSFVGPTATGISVGSGPYLAFDQNGDGLEDVGFIDTAASNTVTYGLHNGAGIQPDLATSISDGYGVTYAPTYVGIAQSNYTKGSGTTFPENDFTSPLYVVSQVVTRDAPTAPGATFSYTQTYNYVGAKQNIQGRGFEGFQSLTMTDSRADAPKVTTYQKTAFPYTGMVYQQDVFQHDGSTLISRTSNTPAVQSLDGATPCQRCFVYTSSTTNQRYEVTTTHPLVSTTVTSRGTPSDNYGNFSSVSTAVTDNDSGSPNYGQSWTTNIVYTINADPGSNWCLNLPSVVTVNRFTSTGEASISRTTNYGVNYGKCRITQQVVAPSTAYQVTTDYEYDDDAGNGQPDFGNVTSVTVTGAGGMTPRTTSIEWTSTASTTGQFPMKVTNALGQASTMDYDFKYGQLARQTDPNGISTSWHYDSFGRKQDEIRPDGTSTVWSYALYSGTSASERLQVTEQLRDNTNAVFRTNTSRFDIFDRPTVSIQQLVSGNSSATIRAYDALGRVQYEYFPYDPAGGNNGYATYSYDALNRVTQAQRPISANNSTLQTTTYQYLGRTTVVTDAEGKQTTKVTDVNGWLRRSQDHNGYYQNFGYDAFGSLKSVTDSQANTLFLANYAYGLQAFQTSTHDMDLGDWGYTPNALGEVVAYTDNKLVSFSATYDALSRLVTRTEPDNVTTWTWGTSGTLHNIGRLQSLTVDSGAAKNYSYDSIGRTSQLDIVADGSTYSYNSSYNNSGLSDTLTYPASTGGYRLKLQYLYQYGMLRQVKDYNASTIFWQANAMNPRGQITQEQLGNGIIIANKNYDAVTGRINYIQCGVGGGACSQNQSYLFDKVGNLTQRQNANLGLTENFYYDNVHRLDYSQLNGVTNLDMTYDNLGNITNRTDIANNVAWTYDSTHKHQVLTAGSNTYSYDQNGNVTSRSGNSISWTSYNYPSQINGAGETINLYYDANRQRYKQIYNNGNTETTLYIGALTQRVSANGNDDYRYTIAANGETVALISCGTGHVCTNSGPNLTRYALSDHQGSVAKFIDSSGNTIVSESFTAFGARRNPQTWSGQPTYGDQSSISGISREGYTGQTALGNLGLNHMNGRVQDAITGRFLSPDPYITEPTNTQNYNRYSYVYNNPLSLVDPTGYSSLKSGDHDENGALVINIYWCDWNPCGDSNYFSGSWSSYAGNPVNNPDIFTRNYESFVNNNPLEDHNYLKGPTTLPDLPNLLANPLMDPVTSRQAYFDQANQAMEATNAAAQRAKDAITAREQQEASGGSGKQTQAIDYTRWAFQATWQSLSTNAGKVWGAIAQSVVGFYGNSDAPQAGILGGITTSGATLTVGRWMSQAELKAMQATGRVQESFNAGVTSVTLPANPAAYGAARPGDVFVRFDIPQSAIGAADGVWGKIFGPNSIFGPAKGITQMPPATNIVVGP